MCILVLFPFIEVTKYISIFEVRYVPQTWVGQLLCRWCKLTIFKLLIAHPDPTLYQYKLRDVRSKLKDYYGFTFEQFDNAVHNIGRMDSDVDDWQYLTIDYINQKSTGVWQIYPTYFEFNRCTLWYDMYISDGLLKRRDPGVVPYIAPAINCFNIMSLLPRGDIVWRKAPA